MEDGKWIVRRKHQFSGCLFEQAGGQVNSQMKASVFGCLIENGGWHVKGHINASVFGMFN